MSDNSPASPQTLPASAASTASVPSAASLASQKPSPAEPSLHLSYGPHIRAATSTAQIMWHVNFALMPALLWAVLIFGWKPFVVTLFAVIGCVAGEAFVNKLQKHRFTISDGSAVCTGILLAFTVPPGVPPWIMLIGGSLAIILAKGIFGGLGYNLFNIALVGRAILMAAFPVAMTTSWIAPVFGNFFPPDAATTSTPLAILKEHGLDAMLAHFTQFQETLGFIPRLLLGMRPGSIGEVSVVCILLGAAFLLWKGIIKLWIPLSVLAGLAAMSLLSPAPIIHFFSGGIWLGAFFMATDYVTSPNMPKGQIIFGLGVGILTGVIRLFGSYPEGVCYAILLMNILTPALNEWFRPKRISTIGVPS